MKKTTGPVHALPQDLKQTLTAAPKAKAVWDSITPLARNEWICWVTSGKKRETRTIRLKKAISKLQSGMRRPCCWAGCPHRHK
ncbi:MAG TPA: YdeI/OmpD-associated family protein [Patescibacteria group bacterium]|nr:YdeI/OmpD-associated family protein [Patescibacteria group bacterium]